MKKDKNSNNWSIFKIRMQLLKIWFLKNLSLFIRVTILVIAILFVTNVIGSESFLVQALGMNELQDAFDSGTIKGWENAIATVLSVAVSIVLFMKKSKSLALEDIKSRDLKIALIKARLYFDENGALCKRAEEATQMDINGDGKIGDQEVEEIKTDSLITGVPQAIGELTTILTTKIELDADEKVIEEAALNEEIDPNVITTSEKLYTEELGAPEVEEEEIEAKSLDDKLKELAEEDESIKDEIKTEQTESEEVSEGDTKKHRHRRHKKNNKEKQKKPSMVGEFLRAFKIAFASLKVNDSLDSKKHKKHKEEKVEDPNDNKTKIEIVDLDEEIKDDAPIEVVNTAPVDHSENIESVQDQHTSEVQPENKQEKTQQEQRIEDIFKNMF